MELASHLQDLVGSKVNNNRGVPGLGEERQKVLRGHKSHSLVGQRVKSKRLFTQHAGVENHLDLRRRKHEPENKNAKLRCTYGGSKQCGRKAIQLGINHRN